MTSIGVVNAQYVVDKSIDRQAPRRESPLPSSCISALSHIPSSVSLILLENQTTSQNRNGS